ncbi:hypothetical protein DSLASN_29430 [Desulfoluna limicola]|uniref:Uncharacterized protein n=1 Tax=Desulfoluna limicola TaxID=2810562 RepID=A0ABM7PIC5_9BACT|nr:hypothetical protein [Desulfoluna limicola]BCS97311.1 hypothetical protein DSLASN_29430 [Desulfoluna limicola]
MAFSALRFHRYVFYMLFVGILFATQAMATPEPMKEWELGGVEAGTGVNLHFDNVSMENKSDSIRFVPDDTAEPDNYIELTDTDGTRTVNGDLSIMVGAYQAPQREWFIKDTAKVRKGSAGLFNLNYWFKHKRKDYTIVKGPDYQTDAEARGIGAVTLSMGNGTDVFMSQDSSMGLRFSADGFVDSSTGDPWLNSGTLSIAGMKTYGQQVTLYPINGIPGYATGEGIALEIRSKTSIDEIELRALDGTLNALVKGVHMRESFNQDVHSLYGKWGDLDSGYFASDDPSEYFQSTYDPDGYYGHTWDPKDTPIDPSLISTPYEGSPDYYNMYDGYMMNGNINQVAFYDLIGGKKLPYDHGQHTPNDTITGNNFDDPNKLDDDYQIHSQDVANTLVIEERPMTIQVKTGRTYNRYNPETKRLEPYDDDRSYVAINWPRHGSVRVEEIQGFVSTKDDPSTLEVDEGWPYEDFGPSLGSVILDGMRAKKTYIEFPGRAEQYVITQQNNHTYVYDAGKLPDGINQTCQDVNGDWNGPAVQADWDPIGRGQLDFLSKLGNTSLSKPPGTPDLNPTGGRWDLYDTKKVVGGVTYDFWHIYEPPYPGAGAQWLPDH